MAIRSTSFQAMADDGRVLVVIEHRHFAVQRRAGDAPQEVLGGRDHRLPDETAVADLGDGALLVLPHGPRLRRLDCRSAPVVVP